MLFRLADAIRGRLQHDLGRRGEDMAHRYLRRKKYTIVARNYRPASGTPGEIDLIAWHDGTLVFIEVKTRSSDRVGFPERAVDDVEAEPDPANGAGLCAENQCGMGHGKIRCGQCDCERQGKAINRTFPGCVQ